MIRVKKKEKHKNYGNFEMTEMTTKERAIAALSGKYLTRG
jgi:hypothetical protein